MRDGFPHTYFKIAPAGFDATVYDTDDLATTRGSSLTLLKAPSLISAHLVATFPAFDFGWIQSSASELLFQAVVRAKAASPPLTIERVTGSVPAGGPSASKWNKALQARANAIKPNISDAALRQAADEVADEFGMARATDDIAGRILAKCGKLPDGPAATPLSHAQCDDLVAAIKAFTSAAQGDWPLDLMMFDVAWFQPAKGRAKPAEVIGALETQLGRAALRRLTCALPHQGQGEPLSADLKICDFTGLFAASGAKEKGRPTSPHARRRRVVGREKKQTFYDDILAEALIAAKDPDLAARPLIEQAVADIRAAKGKVTDFAGDFSEIVARPPADLPKSLCANICVLNMDGNSFGALRAGAKDMGAYRRLSAYLDILKAGMMARILSWIAEDAEMTAGDVARFETLLWGGDEFTFVAPAWKGWALATLIHDAVKDWKTPEGAPMSFATGLAFGPHKAPIRDLKRAAENLAGMAKSAKPDAAWQAVAYESLDRIHFSPGTYRRDWLGAPVGERHFTMAAADAITLPETIELVLTGASRASLHNLYYEHERQLAKKSADTGAVKDQIGKIAPEMPDDRLAAVTDALIGKGDFPLLRFAQINMLFDYIRPRATAS